MSSMNGSSGAGAPLARKKLMGYVGFANLPNQVHRKSVRKGFTFTCMVVGEYKISYEDEIGESEFGRFDQVNLVWESRH